MSAIVGNLLNRALAVKNCAIRDTTLPSYKSNWNGFSEWMKENGNIDPEIVTEVTPNYIAACLTHHFENLNHAAGTIDNIKSAIRHHYKRNLRLEDGWTKNTNTGSYVGNPCDSIEVKELVSGSYNVSKDRGDSSKRAAPMKIEYLNATCTDMLLYLESHPECRVEVLCFLAACSTAFYLWMRIDELFNMKCKHVELNLEKTDKRGYFYHEATTYRRKNDKKNNKRKSRVHEVHKLSELEKGACMKTYLDMWLVELERILGRLFVMMIVYFPL